MGYGTMVYSLDFAAHRASLDSGDDKLRRMISGRFRRDIQRLNEELDWSNERGAPNVFEAIRHLLMGGPKELPGAMYGYGYKFIVEFQGRFLPNDRFYPCRSSYQEEELQPQLDALDLGLRLDRLNFGGALADFPPPMDFPGIGHWDPDEIARARPLLDAATGLSPELEQVRGWLRQAHDAGHGLIGFYH